MNYLYEQVLVSRIKSFLWRGFGVGLAAFLTWLIQEIDLLQLSDSVEQLVVMVLGLALGEVTKYWNVNREWIKSQIL
jgi:hypothetical protein